MAFSRQGNFSNNRGGSFAPRSGGARSYSRPEMFDAVCAKCGANCQVPFRPSGTRDVYCSKCFEPDTQDSRGPRNSDRFARRDSSDRPMYDAVCANCGANCQVPFQPKNGKEVYCRNCFASKQDNQPARPTQASNTPDLGAINAKLDQIIKLLTPVESIAMPDEEKKVKISKKKLTSSDEQV